MELETCGNNCQTCHDVTRRHELPYGGSLLLFGGEFGLPFRGPADLPLRLGDLSEALYRKNVWVIQVPGNDGNILVSSILNEN